MNRTVASLFWLLLLAACPAAHAVTWHVPSHCPTIQAGIDSASAGDTVLVANGTYWASSQGWQATPVGPSMIIMKAGVCLRSEAGIAHWVILDSEWSGRAVYCDDLNVEARIEALTMRRGLSEWGGAVFCQSSKLALSDVTCWRNVTSEHGKGGAVFCSRASYVRLVDCMISENEAFWGGGVCATSGCCLSFSDCVFSGNEGGTLGGGLCSLDSEAMIANCTFIQNLVSKGGGAYLRRGPISISNCSFIENHASFWGGGVHCYYSWPTFSECEFTQNHAGSYGGALFCDNACPILTGCSMVQNTSACGGGCSCEESSPTFLNCVFNENSGSDGGGVHLWMTSSPILENTIIAFSMHGTAVACNHAYGTCSPTFSCCDIYGNEGGDWVGYIADQYGINGNFSECPLFCGPDNGDFHLQDCSPCAPGNHPQGYDCGLIGAFDVGCDCGLPSRVQPTSWSSLKALYR